MHVRRNTRTCVILCASQMSSAPTAAIDTQTIPRALAVNPLLARESKAAPHTSSLAGVYRYFQRVLKNPNFPPR